jgi:hypothetical protein
VNKTHYSSSYKGIDSDVVVLHWCSEYVIPKEGPGTARDALAAERLVDATKEAEETATAAAAAAAAAALSAPEEAQVTA